MGTEEASKTKLENWSFVWILEDNTCRLCLSSKWQKGLGRGIQSIRHPPPPLTLHSSPPHSPVQNREQASTPCGCRCCRWCSDASSHYCWLTGGLAGWRFTQCHGVADSGPNSGTSDALGHSGTGLVGEVGGGVEEVLVVLLVVVVVVRSRYQ